ncbi:MAG TPA: hypothetical protein VGD68_11495 [Streptosporangiaceae bacterium]
MSVPVTAAAGTETIVAGAIVEGVNVDAVAAAVRGCAGVSGLDGGPYHEVATYLPGRTVDGVAVHGDRVQVQVRSRWGIEAPLLAALIKTVLGPLTGTRPVDIAIADIDDPPVLGSATGGPSRPSPGLPPG